MASATGRTVIVASGRPYVGPVMLAAVASVEVAEERHVGEAAFVGRERAMKHLLGATFT
jgi:hypothetical protein